MKLKNKLLAFGVVLMFLSCATNPFSGKKTLALVPNSQIFPTAFAQYDQFLTDNKVITGTKDAEMVKRVGQKIAAAAERYLNANGYQGYLEGYQWEYNLVDDKTVNAWCMPGGKIVVYSGILPVAGGEAGLAAIMGHEVSHALANHGQQRMSVGMLQQLGAVAGNVVIKDQQTLNIFNQAYGVGTQVGVMLPFSRSNETEADQIGLYLMAIAGYNPDEAANLWRRMSAQSGGQAPPEFLSTHPSNVSRIKAIEALAPKAKAEAKKYGVTSFKS
ncbi:MAG: M48 family metallopeptidase [Aquaticitalea sp.]